MNPYYETEYDDDVYLCDICDSETDDPSHNSRIDETGCCSCGYCIWDDQGDEDDEDDEGFTEMF